MGRIDEDREDALEAHQDGRLYPLGRALRATYDAENHDTLGTDVAGLMIGLSHVPYEEGGSGPAAGRPGALAAGAALPPPRSWFARIGDLLAGR